MKRGRNGRLFHIQIHLLNILIKILTNRWAWTTVQKQQMPKGFANGMLFTVRVPTQRNVCANLWRKCYSYFIIRKICQQITKTSEDMHRIKLALEIEVMATRQTTHQPFHAKMLWNSGFSTINIWFRMNLFIIIYRLIHFKCLRRSKIVLNFGDRRNRKPQQS